MAEPSEDTAESAAAVHGRITWGACDQIFTVDAANSQKFDCGDEHGTIVEIAAFDSNRFETIHPVKLTCTATGRFLLTRQLDEAFKRLAACELPKGSQSEDTVKRQSYRDGVYHSYSLPFDQYPAEVRAFISEIYRTLYECASHVWRLLRWRSGARGSHEIFQTVLASEWSRDDQSAWHGLPVKGYARTGGWIIPGGTTCFRLCPGCRAHGTSGVHRQEPPLFPGGAGNTQQDPERFASLYADVAAKIFGRLPDATWVYPGHGGDTTLGSERPHLAEWRARGW